MNRGTTFAAAVAVLLVALPARASERIDAAWVTRGWAGYVVRSAGRMTEVRGMWVQPRVVCNRPGSSISIWVGIGGASRESRTLEQIGTAADCDGDGRLFTSVWYELFPAPPVDVPVAVRAGDTVRASVTVWGAAVVVSLTNVSTGASFSTRRVVRRPVPDTDSAEWIVEAPGACFVTCAGLPLADFNRVQFRDAAEWVAARGNACGWR